MSIAPTPIIFFMSWMVNKAFRRLMSRMNKCFREISGSVQDLENSCGSVAGGPNFPGPGGEETNSVFVIIFGGRLAPFCLMK